MTQRGGAYMEQQYSGDFTRFGNPHGRPTGPREWSDDRDRNHLRDRDERERYRYFCFDVYYLI